MKLGSVMNRIIVFTSLIIVFLLTACTPVMKNSTPIDDPTVRTEYPALDAEYRIQVGDQLDIKLFYNSDLNEQAIVRPDGRISLQLVHEVMAAGLTPAELTRLLTEKYATELKKPELTVIVRSFGAQKVYVDGEVAKPGMFPLLGYVTILQAISQAGGLKESARTNEVVVIRHGANNKPLALVVNLDKIHDGSDMHQNIPLKSFDIVYVPRSDIANVNVWVDQYLRKNIPIQTGFFYNFP